MHVCYSQFLIINYFKMNPCLPFEQDLTKQGHVIHKNVPYKGVPKRNIAFPA